MQALILTLAAFIVTGAALRRHSPTGSRPTPAQRTDLEGIAPHIERAAALLDQLRLLQEENELLRQRVAQLRENGGIQNV